MIQASNNRTLFYIKAHRNNTNATFRKSAKRYMQFSGRSFGWGNVAMSNGSLLGADYCRAKKRAKPYMSTSYRRGQGTPLVCLQIQTAVLWTWGHAGWDGVGAHWKKTFSFISLVQFQESSTVDWTDSSAGHFPPEQTGKLESLDFFILCFSLVILLKLQQLGRPHGTLVSPILCQQQTTAEFPESGDIFV